MGPPISRDHPPSVGTPIRNHPSGITHQESLIRRVIASQGLHEDQNINQVHGSFSLLPMYNGSFPSTVIYPFSSRINGDTPQLRSYRTPPLFYTLRSQISSPWTMGSHPPPPAQPTMDVTGSEGTPAYTPHHQHCLQPPQRCLCSSSLQWGGGGGGGGTVRYLH